MAIASDSHFSPWRWVNPWLIAIGAAAWVSMSSIRTPAPTPGLTSLGRHRVHHADLAVLDPRQQRIRAPRMTQHVNRPGRVPNANDAAGPTEAAALVHNASSSKASGSSHGSGMSPHTGIDVEITGVGTDLGMVDRRLFRCGGRGVHDLTLPEHTFEYKA